MYAMTALFPPVFIPLVCINHLTDTICRNSIVCINNLIFVFTSLYFCNLQNLCLVTSALRSCCTAAFTIVAYLQFYKIIFLVFFVVHFFPSNESTV